MSNKYIVGIGLFSKASDIQLPLSGLSPRLADRGLLLQPLAKVLSGCWCACTCFH